MNYIYLHGFLSGPDSSKGKFLSEYFSRLGLQLLRPDLNGGDFEHITISSQLAAIEEMLKSLTGEVVLIGSSLGGYLAALCAEQFPGVQKLILMAPAFDFANRYISSFSEQEIKEWKESGFLNLYHYHYRTIRRLHYSIVDDAAKYKNHQLQNQLPVLIFHGTRDRSVPYRLSIEYLKNHPTTELVLLDSDHSLLDKFDIMWTYMRAFLNI